MRLFTLAEAQETLMRLRPLLESMAKAAVDLRRMRATALVAARSAQADGNLVADPYEQGEDRLKELESRITDILRACAAAGVEVKDIERGLIDFRHERDGEVVYLCYELGEEDIGWWHPLDAGYAGRQRI